MEASVLSRRISSRRIVEARRKSVQHRQNVLPQAALRMAVEKKVAKAAWFHRSPLETRNQRDLGTEKGFAFTRNHPPGIRSDFAGGKLGARGGGCAFRAHRRGLLSRLAHRLKVGYRARRTSRSSERISSSIPGKFGRRALRAPMRSC